MTIQHGGRTLSRRQILGLAAAGVSMAATGWPRLALGQAAPTGAALLTRSARPEDLETPVALLDSFITPSDALFVRSHMTVPSVDTAAWRLAIDGDVAAPVSLSVAELRQLPATRVVATLECAGNGRAFFDPPVAGIQWRKGAVGTVEWTGVRLRELIGRASAAQGWSHVWMAGADRPLGTQPPFVRQVPMGKALDPDTLVAYEMNGAPIPLAHGAPLRAVIPGWEGAYSVKWLDRLSVASREHDGFWVASGYRYPTRRVVPGAAVPAAELAPLTGLAVKSLITRPLDGAAIARGPLRVAGFAWGGDTPIAKVEISTDGGASWRAARLTGPVHKYAWRRFEADVSLTRLETYTLLSRATTAGGETQPIVPAWNPSGYLWNAPDRIDVTVRDAAQAPAAAPPAPVSSHETPIEQKTYLAACRTCHDDGLAAQQRLTADGWGRTVDKMARWGARVPADERSALVEFLASRWGVR